MLEEVRITRLGVIDDAVLEFSGGFNVVTGETGAGKTMVVTGLGLLFGGRADPARVRPGADRAAVEGRLRVDPDGTVARQVDEAGGDLDDQGSTLLLGRSVSAEGRSRATAGGRSVPVSLLTYLAEDLVAVHGQSDQQQLLRPGRQRQALDRFSGPEFADLLGQLPARLPAAPAGAGRAGRADHPGPRAGPRGRGPAPRPGRDASGPSPAEGEDIELLAEEERLANADALHSAATTAHEALLGDPSSGSYEAADVVVPAGRGPVGAGGGGAARPAAGRAGEPGLRGRLPARPTWPPSWPPTRSRSRPTRPGWRPSRSAGPSWPGWSAPTAPRRSAGPACHRPGRAAAVPAGSGARRGRAARIREPGPGPAEVPGGDLAAVLRWAKAAGGPARRAGQRRRQDRRAGRQDGRRWPRRSRSWPGS